MIPITDFRPKSSCACLPPGGRIEHSSASHLCHSSFTSTTLHDYSIPHPQPPSSHCSQLTINKRPLPGLERDRVLHTILPGRHLSVRRREQHRIRLRLERQDLARLGLHLKPVHLPTILNLSLQFRRLCFNRQPSPYICGRLLGADRPRHQMTDRPELDGGGRGRISSDGRLLELVTAAGFQLVDASSRYTDGVGACCQFGALRGAVRGGVGLGSGGGADQDLRRVAGDHGEAVAGLGELDVSDVAGSHGDRDRGGRPTPVVLSNGEESGAQWLLLMEVQIQHAPATND